MTAFRFAPNIIVAPGTDDATNRETLKRINYAAYERDTLATLEAIWQGSWTGTSIIQGIAASRGMKVIITPYFVNSCNAASDPRPTWSSGSEINVLFLPATWQAGSACAIGPGSSPDAVLLHELVHAYRQIKGHKYPKDLFVTGFCYDTEEEFYAILLTNIHLSAKGEKALRKDHKGHDRLYLELSTSEPFLTKIRDHRRLVHAFVSEHWGLCQEHIKKDQCAFNPIDYFLKNGVRIMSLDDPKPKPPSDADIEIQRLLEELIEKQHLPGKTPPKKPAKTR
jgi:hypothetical protein